VAVWEARRGQRGQGDRLASRRCARAAARRDEAYEESQPTPAALAEVSPRPGIRRSDGSAAWTGVKARREPADALYRLSDAEIAYDRQKPLLWLPAALSAIAIGSLQEVAAMYGIKRPATPDGRAGLE